MTAMYITIAFVWLVLPVAGRFSQVLLGTSIFPYDSFLNAGILEWAYHAIRSPTLRLFDWTAGFPLNNTLAVTENLVGWQIIYTPSRLLGMSIPGAYNVLMLSSLVISAVGALLLARRFGASRAGSAVAGLVFGFGSFHLDHLLHLQTMGVCWSPFAILFLDRYLASRAPRDAVGLAAAFVMSALCSIYFAVFLGIVLPLYAALCWITGRYRFSNETLLGLAATGVFSAAIIMPLLSHYLRFSRAVGYHHSAQTLAAFSMELAAPLRVPDWQAAWAWSPLVRETSWMSSLSYTPAFPGVVALALAIYAIVRVRREPAARNVVWILIALLLISFVLALGPILKPLNLNPMPGARWLPMPGKIWLHIPGIRWPMRIFFFAWLAGAILCGLGLSTLEQDIGPKWRGLIVVAAFSLITLEFWPKSWLAGRSVLAPAPLSLSDAYPFLAREIDRGGVVEEPTAQASGWRTPFATRYIYASSAHLRRIVALHGSVTPAITDSLLASADALPDSAAARVLSSHGVTRVVFHRSLMPADKSAAAIRGMSEAGYPIVFSGHEGVVFSTVRPAKDSSIQR